MSLQDLRSLLSQYTEEEKYTKEEFWDAMSALVSLMAQKEGAGQETTLHALFTGYDNALEKKGFITRIQVQKGLEAIEALIEDPSIPLEEAIEGPVRSLEEVMDTHPEWARALTKAIISIGYAEDGKDISELYPEN